MFLGRRVGRSPLNSHILYIFHLPDVLSLRLRTRILTMLDGFWGHPGDRRQLAFITCKNPLEQALFGEQRALVNQLT